MTRHKNEMANGVRLENASWRTWAKQRSNLKTISPETLNWLKDSDVTWLYGPLHTAVDPVPPPKLSSVQDRFNLDSQPQSNESQPTSSANSRPGSSASTRSAKAPGKPILKHRSLSEILGVGIPRGGESASEDGSEDGKGRRDQPKRARVSIAHTASDSTLVKLGNAAVGRGSSPTITNGYESSDFTSGEESDAARQTFPSNRSTQGGTDEVAKPKKHISFSHRVEQCIAVDSEEERSSYAPQTQLRPPSRAGVLLGSNVLEDDDDDDDDDDVLTFRSSAPRQPGLHAISNRCASTSTGGTMVEPYSLSAGLSGSTSGSSVNEPFTIARMAPTTLKSSEVLPAPSPVVVYDRDSSYSNTNPQSSYVRPTYTVTATPSGSVGMNYTLPNSPPQPASSATAVYSHQTSSSYSSCTYGPVTTSKVLTPPVPSPSHDNPLSASTRYGSSSSINHWNVSTPDDEDTAEFTAMGFDYFSGPDLGLGDEYDMSRISSQHLATFQSGFNPSEMNGKTGNNEDSITPRSILKTHMISQTVPSPPHTGGKLAIQEPILVPQIKSNNKTQIIQSSTSSSFCTSTFSHPNNSSSSSLVLSTDDNANHCPAADSSSTFAHEGAGRLSRGRCSSRGSSASSFERSSIDRRPSSSSPAQSPPLKSSTSAIGAGGSRSMIRPNLSATRTTSYDSGRSFNTKSSLLSASIGEEAEDESELSSLPAPNLLNGTERNSHQNSSSYTPEAKSPCISSVEPTGSSSTVLPGAIRATSQPPQSLISEPKLAIAKLDGLVVTPQPIDIEACSTTSNDNHRMGSSSIAPSESIVSGSPTLLSLLSKQGSSPNLSWWPDDRVNNRSRGRVISDRGPSRPSLRSSNSDSSTSTFIGRDSFSQNGRKSLGANRVSNSMDDHRSSSEDEFGFGNYYADRSPEDEDVTQDGSDRTGVISRAADIVETAKVIVGALWNVGSRSIWGGSGSDDSRGARGDANGKANLSVRRASTGGLNSKSDDGRVSYTQPVPIKAQHSTDDT